MTTPDDRARRFVVRAAASAAAVAVVCGLIELLKAHVPVLSLGVLYIFAVLPVAIFWGLGYAIGVSVLSMLAFNILFLPPLYTVTLADSRNWFALAVFLVTAVVVSELAARSRRQARESALLAQIATSLLERGTVSGELDQIAAETARALQVDAATIELGDSAKDATDGYPIRVADRRVGSILLRGRRQGTRETRRLLPALASLLGVAIDRERLAREAVEAEALRRSDAIKTAVLRAVSHDLRSPLMAILTSAQALVRRDFVLPADDQRELMETIASEATRLDRLVGNLLDLSRLQAGAAAPDPGIWSIDDVVVQALDAVGEAGDRIEVAFPDESPSVQVDVHQIERVLVNLIENALRFSPPKERVQLHVTTTGSDVLIRVVDHGPGVPLAELDQIFEPFQRGSRGGSGAGLGLAIARGFAEANSGRVWAESRAGQGATFVLALPIVPETSKVQA